MNSILKEDLDYIISSNLDWKKFEGKTILITGANGLLPSYMVKTLLYLNEKVLNKKCKVIGLVRNINKAKIKFINFVNDKHLTFVEQDVSLDINIKEDINYVIHAASQASPKYYGIDPVGTLNANVLGTNNTLKLSYEKKVEGMLYFSSGEVYGEINKDMIKENDFGIVNPTNIRSCYAESKRLGETMCVSWSHQYKVPVKIVRPFHTYGPGIELNDGRVFGDFIKNIKNNENIEMKSDGSARRAFCYLSDATVAFFTVLINGMNGEAYNVGNPEQEVSIYELAEKLVELFPEKKLKVIRIEENQSIEYIKSPINKCLPCIDKIRKIGWEPKIEISEGFKRTILSY